MNNKRLVKLPAKEINLKDRTFCLSYPLSAKPLNLFIKESGFISPVILRKKPERKDFQIVSGFKRLTVLKNRKEIPCFIFSESELPNKKAFLLSFYENLSGRQFNEMEKAMAIEKLHSLAEISRDKLVNFYLPLIGIPGNKKYLDNYLSLTKLAKPFKLALARGELKPEAGVMLGGFKPLEQRMFLNLIRKLRLNQNKTRIIINLFMEIGLREGKSLLSLFKSGGISEARNFSSLKDYLLERRYPEYKSYEKKFFNLAKNLKLSARAKVIPPPFFESGKLKIELEVKEEKELEKILAGLNRSFKDGQFGKLLDMV